MEKISAEHISDVLTKYYRRKFKLETNQDNSKIFVIVHSDVELKPIEVGYRSTISLGDVKLTASSADGGSKENTIVICVKDYVGGKIVDSNNIPTYDRDLCRREGKSLELLAGKVSCLPQIYSYEEKENIRLIVEYLGDNVLGKTYSELNEEDLKVLTEILKRQPILQSELNNKNYESIDELARAEFICRSPVEINQLCTTQRLCVSERFFNRFKLENEILVEKQEYQTLKNEMFKKGLDSIFEFQEAAKNHKTELLQETVIPLYDPLEKIAKFAQKFEAILKCRSKFDKKEANYNFYNTVVKMGSDEGLLSAFLRKYYTLDVIFPISNHVQRNQDIIQGDCYPYNMMIKDGKIILIDLFHMSFGPWLSDFVEYITFSNLFCSIDNNEAEALYCKVFGERNYRVIGKKIPNSKENEEEFYDLRKRLELDRTINFAGSVSGQILNFADKFNSYQKEALHKRRGKYLKHINKLLCTKSSDGKDLFANSRSLLEQLLFQ